MIGDARHYLDSSGLSLIKSIPDIDKCTAVTNDSEHIVKQFMFHFGTLWIPMMIGNRSLVWQFMLYLGFRTCH